MSTPRWCIVEYDFPARGDLPPVKMTWYDGGERPELLASLKDGKGQPLDWKNGQLFVGEKGMVLSDYTRNVLLPADQYADFKRPEPFIPASIGHHREWLEAIKNGGSTTCNFDYSVRWPKRYCWASSPIAAAPAWTGMATTCGSQTRRRRRLESTRNTGQVGRCNAALRFEHRGRPEIEGTRVCAI